MKDFKKVTINDIIPEAVDQGFKDTYHRSISNWSYLSHFLRTHQPTAEVVAGLIRMELDGACRQDIIHRLGQRLTSRLRDQLQRQLEDLWQTNANRN